LGATIAFAIGYSPLSAAGFAYAFLFAVLGAVLLTLSRRVAGLVSQEAFVGVLYVMATAATVLVVDQAPQGAEHVKKILVGSILTVSPETLLKFAAIYATIGFLHFLARRPLLALSENSFPTNRPALSVLLWDFFFFLSFGAVVTSSVGTAGVLLVFCFLIVPAVIGSLFSRNAGAVLVIAWATGIAASAAGLAASFALDLPTGAAMVAAFGISLIIAGLAKALFFVEEAARRKNQRSAAKLLIASALASILLSSAWLVANPAADQPMIALIEFATGLSPAAFLSESGRAAYEGAIQDARRFQKEFDPSGRRSALPATEPPRLMTKKYGGLDRISSHTVRWRAESFSCLAFYGRKPAGANAGLSGFPFALRRFWDFFLFLGGDGRKRHLSWPPVQQLAVSDGGLQTLRAPDKISASN
jgi:zinc/manganese transport system permease protein